MLLLVDFLAFFCGCCCCCLVYMWLMLPNSLCVMVSIWLQIRLDIANVYTASYLT